MEVCKALVLPAMAEERAELFLDESRFAQSLRLQALRVPKRLCGQVSKLLAGYVIDKPRVKHIVNDPADAESRLVIFSESVKDPSLHEIPDEKLNALKDLVDLDVTPHEILLSYEHWSADHVLREILPKTCEVPSSFETIGHIAHLNLRDEHLPYKKLIGKVLLDKNPKLKTVLNKVGTIKNEFRVPSFELLAGEDNMVTEVKQYGAIFHLNYGLVYWNSRLEHEHKRLVSEFQPGQVICDMFAGVGPFAIPAAQKGCLVYANDLNPASVEYLLKNADVNKVGNRIVAYNMDAREFMKELVNPATAMAHALNKADEGNTSRDGVSDRQDSDTLKAKVKRKQTNAVHSDVVEAKPWEHFDHVVMNLPASALTFLDTFRGLLSKDSWKGSMPCVHCYCFLRAKQTTADIMNIAENTIRGSLPGASIWTVRLVAPNKTMLCLSFMLPESIAFGQADSDVSQTQESGMKRPRTV
ncbi:tRNA (guanine(37)-N1)-methyltransferase isoform X1 [Selaginella moellendorffii]|uniref:tRNA (guanine(37)-N1)-methyltransferase isoform X1 n=1 Tax=Selaginella moellendorffii TaxID=88036 RepID=UPI000D1C3EC1|nr:tRNA (guanine(37)-N1)-methyltransferase isoform X1 [Selaginella moellendorffii]|eukprot:XP_024518521.1 tRNA (guanine(37)-N1)-methyltransferase isoform X1 [Selaginella moellendorffii]